EDITGLKFDCLAKETSVVGKYIIVASGAASSNYTIYYVDGKLTILAKSISDAEITCPEKTYNGSAHKLTSDEFLIKVNGRQLKENVDYQVLGFVNNTNAGTATVKVKGIGNYTGMIETPFTINKAKDSITLSITGWTYGDSANSPEGQSASGNPLTYQYLQGGKVLSGVPTAAGTYYVKATVEDSDNYEGSTIQRPFTIAKRSLEDENIRIEDIVNQRYTGQEVTPEVIIYDGYRGVALSAEDYTLVYRDNTEVGVATVTIIGKGNYTDSVTKEFKIQEYGFFEGNELPRVTYNGDSQKPVIEIPGCVEGVDYIVTYETDCTSAGVHTIVITGIGKFAHFGSQTLYYYIEKAKVQVVVNDQTVTYGESYEFVAEPQGLLYDDVLTGEAEFHYYADENCTVEISNPQDAGTYYVKASGYTADNYDISYMTGKLVIQKAENRWIKPLSIKGWVAGKKSSEPKAEAKLGKVTYKYFADKACKKEISKPAKAGTYYVKAYVAEGKNYLALESDAVSFVIKKAVGKDQGQNLAGGSNDKDKDKDKNKDKDDDNAGPNTGDSNSLIAWLAVLMTSILGVGALTRKRRRG
ncbi:MAG: LPXTG cell wall anchor domain-containing protein, partial [Firmicutes bacterium]|nr:LPXTG cell wall anchor domain-containing protein [Bacillota bacterium]